MSEDFWTGAIAAGLIVLMIYLLLKAAARDE